jgi:hypothetical protein
MPPGVRELLTRRRLGGAALVLAGLVVAGVVLWPAVTGDDARPARAAPTVRLVSIPQLGLAFAHPRSWKRSVKRKVIRLRSPDNAAVMTVSSPVAGRRPEQVKAALLRTLRARLKRVTLIRDGPGRLGPRSVASLELSGGGPAERARVLALVEDTAYRTYAITLLTPARPSRKRLLEAAQILASVRLTKPSVASKR